MENTILWLVALLLLTFPFLWSLNEIQNQSNERSTFDPKENIGGPYNSF